MTFIMLYAILTWPIRPIQEFGTKHDRAFAEQQERLGKLSIERRSQMKNDLPSEPNNLKTTILVVFIGLIILMWVAYISYYSIS